MSVLHLGGNVEGTGPLAGVLLSRHLGGNLGAQDQAFVKATGASEQELLDHLQRVAVFVTEAHGPPHHLHLGIGFSLGVITFFAERRNLKGGHLGRRLAASRDAPEIALRHGHGSVGLEVTHENEREVLRLVVQGVEFVGLFLGNGRDVAGPSNHRPVVGVGVPEHGIELFGKFANRGRFGAHPPLFEHDVAFGIELAKHGPEQALALHPHPQLQLIGRDGDVVGRHVLGGEGVHA